MEEPPGGTGGITTKGIEGGSGGQPVVPEPSGGTGGVVGGIGGTGESAGMGGVVGGTGGTGGIGESPGTGGVVGGTGGVVGGTGGTGGVVGGTGGGVGGTGGTGVSGGTGGVVGGTGGTGGTGVSGGTGGTGGEDPTTTAYDLWRDEVQPAVAERCGSCHLGKRFAFASLERAGAAFTDDETLANYRAFFPLLNLDAPEQSRIFAKTFPESDPRSMAHGGGALLDGADPLATTLLDWALAERDERCDDCGLAADRAFVAFVDSPSLHWAAERDPIRSDLILRHGARIMLQPIDPATLTPVGAPIDFLPESFCGPNGECDFGRIAANHAGTQLAFECRMPVDAEPVAWLDESWNLCLADIGPDGSAVNPRFLAPPEQRHQGWTVSRTTPFGITDASGWPVRSHWDLHFQIRRTNDLFPVYTPDDSRLVFSSRSADPRTGVMGTRTYHGFEHTNNIISTDLFGGARRTLYLNEGGVADSPTFLRNGNIAFHTWNLERMDRHLYVQSTADGMLELPVLFGRTQGPNMWGPLTQLANGGFIGMTGHRRGSVELFVPFFSDHTIGLGNDPAFPGFSILDQALADEIPNEFSYCQGAPNGANCSTSRYYADPSYSPDGRALISYTPERTYYTPDSDTFYYDYGADVDAVRAYVPELRVAFIDARGGVQTLVSPPGGRSYRYPTYVARRQAPVQQQTVTDEGADWAEVHFADFRLWFAFREQPENVGPSLIQSLDAITSVRVLVKELAGNACTNDGHPYRRAVYDTHDHPTHLGINNSTGYTQLSVPESAGGDAFGNVPLAADGSVKLRVPAGELLLFQGVDADGHLVRQHTRVFALPPGHQIDTSVRRDQYSSQCATCHGSLDHSSGPLFGDMDQHPAVFDFDTLAKAAAAVDLVDAATTRETLTFLDQLRPILDDRCVGCHSGGVPAGELTLGSAYSDSANAPAGRWMESIRGDYAAYLASLPAAEVVRGYDWSPARDFVLQDEPYRSTFIDQATPRQPLASLAPWDPAYQTLFLTENPGDRLYYLTAYEYAVNVGRGGDYARTSFLLEVLTGRDLDPRRDYSGPDHTNYLSEREVRMLIALIDNGFPYAARCADRVVPSGPNIGRPWGDSVATIVHP